MHLPDCRLLFLHRLILLCYPACARTADACSDGGNSKVLGCMCAQCTFELGNAALMKDAEKLLLHKA